MGSFMIFYSVSAIHSHKRIAIAKVEHNVHNNNITLLQNFAINHYN